MDQWTQERYGPLTEADLWRELYPGLPLPTRLRNAVRAKRLRDRRAAELERLVEAA